MRLRPSFYPSICYHRVWTDYDPVNTFALQKQRADDFPPASTAIPSHRPAITFTLSAVKSAPAQEHKIVKAWLVCALNVSAGE